MHAYLIIYMRAIDFLRQWQFPHVLNKWINNCYLFQQ